MAMTRRKYVRVLACSTKGCRSPAISQFNTLCQTCYGKKRYEGIRAYHERKKKILRDQRNLHGNVPINEIRKASSQMVSWAKRVGWLPKLDGAIECVDCGIPASCWEHRDYTRPLDVDPVCRGCNVRRGASQTRMDWNEREAGNHVGRGSRKRDR